MRSSILVPAMGLVAIYAVMAAGCDGGSGGGSASAVGAQQTCYRLPTGEAAHAVVLSGGDTDLMTCAMHVEAWRLMNRVPAATGLFQGHYVFASSDGGITSAETLRAPRFHVYSPGQQADIDAKVRLLIQRQKDAAGNVASDNAAGG